jgi:hypothetical protein
VDLMLAATISASMSEFHPKQLERPNNVLRAWLDARDPSARSIVSSKFATATNKASGVVWSEATNRIPLANSLNGGPAFAGDGNGYLTTTEAAVLACFAGLSQHTVVMLGSDATPDANHAYCGCGTTGQATFDSMLYGSSTTGSGAYRANRTNTSTTTVRESSVVPSTSPHCLIWQFDGTSPKLWEDDVAVPLTLTAFTEPKTINSPDRFGVLCQPRDPIVVPTPYQMGILLVYSGLLDADGRALVTRGTRAGWGL